MAVYKNDIFLEMLSLRNDFKFRGPRNVICVNLKNKVVSNFFKADFSNSFPRTLDFLIPSFILRGPLP